MVDPSNAVDISYLRMEELKYMHASNANVSNFVSVNLSGESKYNIWKAQMLCLMESQKMRCIVDSKYQGLGATTEEIKKQYDSLLKGWIFDSLSEDVLSTVLDLESARAVWRKLKSIYDPKISTTQQAALSSAYLSPTSNLFRIHDLFDGSDTSSDMLRPRYETLHY
ncbi:hypothetical protein Tco_1274634 [Tanacetum coccineum]